MTDLAHPLGGCHPLSRTSSDALATDEDTRHRARSGEAQKDVLHLGKRDVGRPTLGELGRSGGPILGNQID